MTGAEQKMFFVNVPAAAQGSSATTSARSRRSGSLRKPAWTPAALKPRALVTPPPSIWVNAVMSIPSIGFYTPTASEVKAFGLIEAENDVRALDGLAGSALPQVVDRADRDNHASFRVIGDAHLRARRSGDRCSLGSEPAGSASTSRGIRVEALLVGGKLFGSERRRPSRAAASPWRAGRGSWERDAA